MRQPGLRHPARLAGSSLLRLQSDERLAELAGSGHESAFDAIVDRYRTPLTRYCAGIVGPSRAEDAVQQALINAHDALQRTDEVRNLRSWLYRIAHNAALNVLRAVRDDVPLEEDVLHGGGRGGAPVGVPGAVSPAESFERSEQFRSTLAALQALPERQRAALVLRELEGRSHEEIAAALGVTKGSARQHLMRARVAVRSAVTAVTPYPLISRLAEWASAGAGAGAPGWAEGAATAGAGASLAKLTAGLAATGALVGGAVGTGHIVHHRDGDAEATPRAAERSVQGAVKRAGAAATGVVALPAAATTTRAETATGGGSGAAAPGAKPHRSHSERAAAKAPSHRDRTAAVRPAADTGPAATTPETTSTTPSSSGQHGRGRDDAKDDHASAGNGRGKDHTSSPGNSDSSPGHTKTTKNAQGKGKDDQDDDTTSSNRTKTPTSAPSTGAGSSTAGAESDDTNTTTSVAEATTTPSTSTTTTTASTKDDEDEDEDED